MMVDPNNVLYSPSLDNLPPLPGTNSFSFPNPLLLIMRVPWVYGNKYLPGLGDVPPRLGLQSM